ncbi:MAG: MBL fold metallo-hydrolase [Candidatus Omnitrophica bacterium]|nr:MBL fold metallo-hydrolase [Candidatus Omnitrophota bacterium]
MNLLKRLYIKQVEVGPMQNYMYILGDQEKKEAVIVDPAWEVDRVLNIAKGDDMKVDKALITHTHFDHVNGIEDFLRLTGGCVYVHQKEAPFLKGMKSSIESVQGGQDIRAGEIVIKFLHTPGHTPGSQCFLVEDHLVSGDTLFINACGRCDLPGGNAEEMYRSLTEKLMKLDDRVLLLPGHNYSEEPVSSMGKEKRDNPYLGCKTLNEFLRFRMGTG